MHSFASSKTFPNRVTAKLNGNSLTNKIAIDREMLAQYNAWNLVRAKANQPASFSRL
jgi:hypothetical protein